MTLREARFFKGLNQWDISVRTGIAQSRISLIERGYVVPKEGEKKRIAKALNHKIEDIFPENQGQNNNEAMISASNNR
ncbi:MAG TPA: helix-turn-helix transcriptional regulator [Desulfatiglandales bacterium]|nr:helix-turn-helix transcriptional regulator [Desulfatiglandales bacterium]